MYILGTQIDFIDDIAGSYLKIVNPNATSECGCGESFSVWVEYAKSWWVW